MAEERTYTEKELEEMANLLLADEEPAPEAKPKKKAAAKGKKEPAPEQPVKTPEERLNELVEKGKKNGKLTAKELECLEDMNLDSEVIDKRTTSTSTSPLLTRSPRSTICPTSRVLTRSKRSPRRR